MKRKVYTSVILSIAVLFLTGCGPTMKSLTSGKEQSQGWRPTVPDKPPQSNTAVSNDLLTKLLNQQRKMRGQEKIAPPPEQPAAEEEKEAPKQEKEQTATPPAKADATPDESTSLAARVSKLEERVETNVRVWGTTQKLVLKNKRRISHVEARQKQIDRRLSSLLFRYGRSVKIKTVRIGNFPFGEKTLTEDMLQQLKSAAKTYNETTKKLGKQIELSLYAFSDSAGGTEEKNQKIADDRAENCKKKLFPLLDKNVKIVKVEGIGSAETAVFPDNERRVRIEAKFAN